MKYSLPVAVALLSLISHHANADPQTERIRKGAEENSAALAAGDYDRVVDFTYPKVVEMIGGRKKMIEILRRLAEDMKSHGTAILGADVSEPKEVVASGSKRFAIIPTVVRMKVPEGTLRSKGFLLGISADEGKTWTFIDGAGITKEKLALVLPEFPPQLTLPSREPPVLEPK